MGAKIKKINNIAVHCKHTELVDPKSIKEHPRNPNTHPNKQIKILADNIETYGWRHPIVVSNLSGLIIAGHARRQAAIKLGCLAPVDYQDFDDENEELAVLLSDNIIPELAELNDDLLQNGMDLLREESYNLETLGFFDEENILEVADDINKIEEKQLNPYNEMHILLCFRTEISPDVYSSLENTFKIDGVKVFHGGK